MKTLRALIAIAVVCSTLAPSPRAQQKAPPAVPTQREQKLVETPPVQPTPAAPEIDKISIKGVGNYTEKRDYLLGPSDVIELRVFNDPQFNGEFEVDPDGNIIVPFIEDPVRAQCRSVNALRREVSSAIAKFLKEPRVYMRVKEQKSRRPAVVYGAVRAPAQYDMRRPVRLLELLSSSGGVTEQQSGMIQIMHTEAAMCPDAEPDLTAQGAPESDPLGLPYTLYKVSELKMGKSESNPYVRPGDIINVVEASPVYVVGNVAAPANLYLREGTTLTRALAQVGGVKEANEEKVRIYRRKQDEPQQVMTVNYKAIKQGKEQDVVLQPYDIIEVPKRGAFAPASLGQLLIGIATSSVRSLGSAPVARIIY